MYMEDIKYLNFIDDIDCPTTEDIHDFFRIFSILLKKEANNGRWEDINSNNITVYEISDNNEVGVKLEYGRILRLGIRFRVSKSTGRYSLFLKAIYSCTTSDSNGYKSDLQRYNDCELCSHMDRCNNLYQGINTLIKRIRMKYTNVLKVDFSTIDISTGLHGSYCDFFREVCEYLDFILPLVKLFTLKGKDSTVATKSLPPTMETTPTSLNNPFSQSSSNLQPCFMIYEEETDSIEDIYNKPHGMEYEAEKLPF